MLGCKLFFFSSARKSFGLIPAAFIILFSLFYVDIASAAVTVTFKSKCRWTTSDGNSFPHSDCIISYGSAGVMSCSSSLTPYGTVYGVTFPNGPSVTIEVDCSNNIYSSRNNILIYDVDGRSAFNCPKKIDPGFKEVHWADLIDEYNHSICFWNGEKIEFYTPGGCC